MFYADITSFSYVLLLLLLKAANGPLRLVWQAIHARHEVQQQIFKKETYDLREILWLKWVKPVPLLTLLKCNKPRRGCQFEFLGKNGYLLNAGLHSTS
jgi:hypothetical protein